MSIKLSRFNAIFNGMNGTAKKVYEAVPKREYWSAHKIIQELERKGGIVSAKAVSGCLGYMLSAGVIEQNREGQYIRTEIKIAKSTPDEPITTPPPTQEQIMAATDTTKMTLTLPKQTFQKNGSNDTLSNFSQLATRARNLAELASDLEDAARKLADDIETAALAASESQDRDAAELAKLRQLKALLGSLQE